VYLPMAIAVAVHFSRNTITVGSQFTSSRASSTTIGIPSLGSTLTTLSGLAIDRSIIRDASIHSGHHAFRTALAGLATLSRLAGFAALSRLARLAVDGSFNGRNRGSRIRVSGGYRRSRIGINGSSYRRGGDTTIDR
jgi:hypothetical protein